MKVLFVGGARSGKSTLAARKAAECCGDVRCIVTASATDAEMAARIEAHRRERPDHWRVREAPIALAGALREEADPQGVLLVDCLTLWLSNCLWSPASVSGAPQGEMTADLERWRRERDAFIEALSSLACPAILVSNEVGGGIVPASAAARMFRDEQGWLNQAVAAACDEVFLVTAGLPLRLK
jgi:adenosylcobinamide kinase/adenosylcobinamide-phosphate guanylyltransferase